MATTTGNQSADCQDNAALHKALTECINNGYGHLLKDSLHALMTHKPEFIPVKWATIEEVAEWVEDRTHLARRFQDDVRRYCLALGSSEYWQFNNWQSTVWWHMGDDIVDYRAALENKAPVLLAVKAIWKSLHIREKDLQQFWEREIQPNRNYGFQGERHARLTNEFATIERDKRACIIMGTALPEAASILDLDRSNLRLPLWDLKCTGTSRKYEVNSPLLQKLRDEFRADMKGRLSDDARPPWSMISLSPQLRDWWERYYFNLEPMGIIPEDGKAVTSPWRVKLRFRWCPIPSARDDSDEFVDLELCKGKPKVDLYWYYGNREHKVAGGGVVAATIPGSSQPLRHGLIFYVTVPTEEDAIKMCWAFDLRYTLTGLARSHTTKNMSDMFGRHVSSRVKEGEVKERVHYNNQNEEKLEEKGPEEKDRDKEGDEVDENEEDESKTDSSEEGEDKEAHDDQRSDSDSYSNIAYSSDSDSVDGPGSDDDLVIVS